MTIRLQAEKFLQESIIQHASDLMILPKSSGFSICVRTVWHINELAVIDQTSGEELINYFKFMAQMDIAEHRRPQAGAWVFLVDRVKYHLRFSSIGDYQGNESLVIRIIYEQYQNHYFFLQQFEELESLIKRRGLLITSGPTGSGKTSTMYQLARNIGQQKLVMTVEDPVEIHESAFFQSQVNLTAGLDYASLVKAALRHRPDILIIGEIRDETTADIAMNAALSGHTVLATVHAKSTFQTIERLKGLGVSLIVLKNCLTAICYQRLLPTCDQRISGLFDIASSKKLQNALEMPSNNDFVNWSEHLTVLREKGIIDDETWKEYQTG